MELTERSVTVESADRFEVCDVTPEVRAAVEEMGVAEGIVWASTPHTSAALSTNEFEEKLLWDMERRLLELVPPDDGYYHDTDHVHRGEDPNAHAHILASLVDRPVLALVRDGDVELGTWESILLYEFCGPRQREVGVVALE